MKNWLFWIIWLTPSIVQVHVTHGEVLLVFPTSIILFPTVQSESLSLQNEKSMSGKLLQWTRGFLYQISLIIIINWINCKTYIKESGKSKSCLWIVSIESEFWHNIFAKVIFLISLSCASVNRTKGFDVSYLN